jgi:hypothetical protein
MLSARHDRRNRLSRAGARTWNQANKLSRTYATLIEALNRHRGKGQQKVTVEHVHVHAGGQAVVGMAPQPAMRSCRVGFLRLTCARLCDAPFGLPPPCDSSAAAPRGYTASPLNGAVDRGARQHEGILSHVSLALWPARSSPAAARPSLALRGEQRMESAAP